MKKILIAAVVVFETFAVAAADKAPIGVFDSGVGGFTVLEQMFAMDLYDNATGERKPDGCPDFERERFVYFGDQANMPYGDYSAADKSDYLKKLIVDDAEFLLGKKAKIKVFSQGCAGLADAVEAGSPKAHEIAKANLRVHLDSRAGG
ncbi:MAG: hypothetical protein PHE10_07690 [Kiritimatiellae bacterium]|nr:hypothetical protein [Kiritimatiellia bacterium]